MSLNVVMSLSMERVSGDLAPFWRPDTKRLVVIVRRPEDGGDGLIACGIDPDLEKERPLVFDASFPRHRLCDFIAMVMGSEKLVIDRGDHALFAHPASRAYTSSPEDAAQAPQQAVAAPSAIERYDIVVVPDPGAGGNGPKLVSYAQALVKLDRTSDQVAA